MTLEFNEFWFTTLLSVVKILAVFAAVLTSVPFMVLLERKLIGFIQQRPGPNRVGPWGILQTFVDGIKLFLKEDIQPTNAERPLHLLAPLLTVVPAIFILSILPLGPMIDFNPAALSFSLPGLSVNFPDIPGYSTAIGITDLDEIGILFYLAVTGVAVYGIVLAGWASNSKYSLIGGIRSSAQMLSYELPLGLSLLGVLLIAGTLQLRGLIDMQSGGFWTWNMIAQPVGFVLFLLSGFAETNRLPFDLPEGESELGAGFHTEYSSMKFAMFFMAEYMNMFTFAAIFTTLFLGGFHPPLPLLYLGAAEGSLLYGAIGLGWFSVKIFLLTCFFVFIRGTLPRFRYDQLMDLGWKIMLPLAFINLILTAGVLAFSPLQLEGPILDPGVLVVLFAIGIAQLIVVDWVLTQRKKRIIGHVS